MVAVLSSLSKEELSDVADSTVVLQIESSLFTSTEVSFLLVSPNLDLVLNATLDFGVSTLDKSDVSWVLASTLFPVSVSFVASLLFFGFSDIATDGSMLLRSRSALLLLDAGEDDGDDVGVEVAGLGTSSISHSRAEW